MVTKINDFHEDLKFSEEASEESFWQEVYQKAFHDLVFANPTVGKMQGQFLGIDRVVYLKSGKVIFIDEKKRRKVWNDIALEYKSNSNNNVNDGWMNKDLLIDYIAYAFMPTQTVYLLDWLSLKRAWINKGIEWKKLAKKQKSGFRIISAPNHGYTTMSIGVPISVLLKEISNPVIVSI